MTRRSGGGLRRAAGLVLVWMLLLPAPLTAGSSRTPAPKKADALSQGEVTFPTEKGPLLHALYFPGKPKGPAVVLIHMDGRSSEDWRHFGDKLSKVGFHALALDLRGHGKSTAMPDGKTLTYDMLDEAQYLAMIKDVAAAVNYVRTRTNADPKQVSIIGASIGANLAIRYAADDPAIANVLLLSPGLDYKGVAAEDAVQRYGERPLFIAVSREDNFSAKSSLVLDSMAKGKKYLQVYTGAGHGTRMMSREPGLTTVMTSWLNGTMDVGGDDDMSVPMMEEPPVRPSTRSR